MKKTVKAILVAAGLVLAVSAFASAQNVSSVIKNHYIGKPVQLKLPVPEGTPMLVYPQREDKLDSALYQLKISRGGVGLDVGAYAVITEVDVRNNELTFELVGVGFDPPPSGLPPSMFTREIWDAGSGKVRLMLEESLPSGDDLLPTINTWLETVVSTRTLVTDHGLPPDMREAIRGGIVTAGMTALAVYLTVGDPHDIVRELNDGNLDEAWLYYREDFSTLMIYFRNGVVINIREF